jgi:hypothetical protein
MPTEMVFDADLAQILDRLRSAPVGTDTDVKKVHPIVKRTADNLRNTAKAQKNEGLVWTASREPVLNVGVGRGTIDRAIGILEVLVRRLELAGFRIEGPTVVGHGMTFRIRLREKTSQVRHKPKRGASELDLFMAPKVDYIPNGTLGLEVGDDFNAWSTRRSIWETKTTPLDALITSAPARLLMQVQERRQQQAARRAAEERQAEEERHRRQKQERLDRRRKRDEALFELADEWRRCESLRGFIAAVRRVAVEEVGFAEIDPQIAKWLVWAERVAGRHDPLDRLRRSAPKRRRSR